MTNVLIFRCKSETWCPIVVWSEWNEYKGCVWLLPWIHPWFNWMDWWSFMYVLTYPNYMWALLISEWTCFIVSSGVVVWDDENSTKRAFANLGMTFIPSQDSEFSKFKEIEKIKGCDLCSCFLASSPSACDKMLVAHCIQFSTHFVRMSFVRMSTKNVDFKAVSLIPKEIGKSMCLPSSKIKFLLKSVHILKKLVCK